MRIAAILASVVAVILSAIWLFNRPSLEAAIALATSSASLFASITFVGKSVTVDQSQKISGESMGIQAGRDVHIDSSSNDRTRDKQ